MPNRRSMIPLIKSDLRWKAPQDPAGLAGVLVKRPEPALKVHSARYH